MPVSTRARPCPSRDSVSRIAVSVVVRMIVASRLGAGPGLGTERAEQEVVLRRPAHGDPDSVGERPDDEALRLEPVRPGLLGREEEEVGRRRSDVVAGRDERRPHPLAFLDRRLDVTEPGRAESCRSDRRRRPGDRCRRPALGRASAAVAGMRHGVAHAERGEAEGLGQRPDRDEVLELVDPRRARPRAVLDVRLVDHHGRLRARRARARPASSASTQPPTGLFGLQTQRSSAASSAARHGLRRAAWSRCRRAHTSARRSPRDPGPEERLRDEEDEVVRACADDDVLRGEPDVGCRGLAEVAVRALGVLFEPRMLAASGTLRHPGERRRVLVEAGAPPREDIP